MNRIKRGRNVDLTWTITGHNTDGSRTAFRLVKGYDGYAGEKATRRKLNR